MTKAERTIGTPGFEQERRREPAGERQTAEEAAGAEPDDAPAGPDADRAAPPSGEAATGTAVSQAHDADGAADAERRTGGGRRRIAVLFGVAAFAYALDLISKTLVVQHLENQPAIQLLGHYLQLSAIRNSGAAFGIGQGMTVVFTLIALIVIVVIARLARKLYSLPWAVALGLLLGGALGNLTDRIFRSPGVFQGGVVDFIAPAHFAVFNLADSAIVCGGLLVVWLSFRGLDPDGTVHRD